LEAPTASGRQAAASALIISTITSDQHQHYQQLGKPTSELKGPKAKPKSKKGGEKNMK
jgi:hypothetical protein